MSEYCERKDNHCSRCLKNSPVASLIGFVLVLIGAGAFGGATIFARRYLISSLNEPEIFPCLEYAVYGLIGALGLFSLLAYFLCAISSGSNAKHCFESSRRSACGRCCNMTLLLALVSAILIWSAILCLLVYAVVSIRLLQYRDSGPTRIFISQLEVAKFGPNNRYLSEQYGNYAAMRRMTRQSDHFQTDSDQTEEYNNSEFNWPDAPDNGAVPATLPADTVNSLDAYGLSQSSAREHLPIGEFDHRRSHNESAETLKNKLPQSSTRMAKGSTDLNLNSLSSAESLFYKCDENTVDLSYYGLYHASGFPIRLARKELEIATRDVFICVCIATAGIFLILLGYLQIVICTAMNYARLQERRYYEISEAGEEGVALNQ